MGKISLEVRIPALDATYEFLVPEDMSIREAQKLMLRILSSEYGIAEQNTDMMLFDRRDQKALWWDCSFAQLGLFDGAKLLLM